MGRKKKILPELKNVEITGIAAEGKALARVGKDGSTDEQFVVFIPYGAPGDIADIKIDKKKKSYAEGHITNILKPSDIRITPACKHFEKCGGCKWQHLPYEFQKKYKHQQVVDVLERISKVDFPEVNATLGAESVFHYRNKMEYTFSNKKWRTWEEIKSGKEFDDSSNALGFHISGAFDKVLHIDDCKLQCESGNCIRNFIYDYAESHGYSFYDIKENKGLLRTLILRNSSLGESMICVVFGEEDSKKISSLMDAIAEKFPKTTSLLYIINKKMNDTITDQEVIVYRGSDYITEGMEDLSFRVNIKSFYQTNSQQAYQLYKVARKFAGLETSDISGEKPLVYDLYTGTGTIANFVARQCRQVIGIEYVPEAIEDARLNSKVNHINNTLFYAGDMKEILTDEFVAHHGRPDIIIVDPPRAGMHEDVIKVILNCRPDTIVYISCNPATQARDLALLDALYKVEAVQPVDMFPHTHHIENVVKLTLR